MLVIQLIWHDENIGKTWETSYRCCIKHIDAERLYIKKLLLEEGWNCFWTLSLLLEIFKQKIKLIRNFVCRCRSCKNFVPALGFI